MGAMQRSSWIAVKKVTQDNKRTNADLRRFLHKSLHTGPECPPRYVGEGPQTKRTNTPLQGAPTALRSGPRECAYRSVLRARRKHEFQCLLIGCRSRHSQPPL